MQQQELLPFQFQGFTLRVERDDDSEPVFHAGDLCAMLGYANARDAITRHVDEGDVVKRDTLTEGGRQLMNWVRESGLWSLILGSHAPNAQPIKRWVTADVLPAIRKTGSYRLKGKPMSTSLLIESHNHILRLTSTLRRETNPGFRDLQKAMVQDFCRATGLPVPTPETLDSASPQAAADPGVAQFWAAVETLGGIALFDHSANPRRIALNLPEILGRARSANLDLPPWSVLKRHLKSSLSPRFLTIESVHSRPWHRRNAGTSPRRPKTVKCWLFEPVQPSPPS